ncbi:MAG: hypothetical protein P0Y56_02060 [Candidatus Andeanibacterium colombiense]|uniref:LuxR family transcriptional regulator n=1 Tax=Candidatus Andeanibacterium colombiense TaxID=3121345 RepID=A0AAJ6BNH4_9SPHN|nr:MAG: hypothetical protein P0Y56_02060 [Sphingomonadaceae bacterium]
MKLAAILAATALFCSAPAFAEKSPLLGSWSVDTASLPVPEEQRPKSVIISFSEAEGGKWHMDVEITLADGTYSHGITTFALDGTLSPASGNPEADLAAARLPAPGVLIVGLSKGGVPGSFRVYAIQPDGDHQIETASYFNPDGTPYTRFNYFIRVK